MRFYTGGLTDGALSFREPTKWALGAQNWGSTEWFLHCAWHGEYVSLTINTTALAEPFLASFLKEMSCICPFPPVTVELMDRESQRRETPTRLIKMMLVGKRGGILLKLTLRAALHSSDHAGENNQQYVVYWESSHHCLHLSSIQKKNSQSLTWRGLLRTSLTPIPGSGWLLQLSQFISQPTRGHQTAEDQEGHSPGHERVIAIKTYLSFSSLPIKLT